MKYSFCVFASILLLVVVSGHTVVNADDPGGSKSRLEQAVYVAPTAAAKNAVSGPVDKYKVEELYAILQDLNLDPDSDANKLAFVKKVAGFDTKVVTAAVKKYVYSWPGVAPDPPIQTRTYLLTIYLFQVPVAVPTNSDRREDAERQWYYEAPIVPNPAFPSTSHFKFLVDTMWPFGYDKDGHLALRYTPLYASPKDFILFPEVRSGGTEPYSVVFGSYLYCSTHYPRRTNY